jgi:predicted GNAT family N-acyltransferase
MQIFQIEFATPAYDEAVRLRYEVLRRPLGLEFTPEQLAAEYADIHLAAFNDTGHLIGYLCLTPLNNNELKMRQVAIASEWQGKGAGSKLVAASEELAAQLNFKTMTMHARETAVPFYLRLGYRIVGDRFEEVTIPHVKMEKKLN